MQFIVCVFIHELHFGFEFTTAFLFKSDYLINLNLKSNLYTLLYIGTTGKGCGLLNCN